jgi:UDP-2,3-diacylglucosamine pyrophosphatase LpxH
VVREAERHDVQGVICGHIHHPEIKQIGSIQYMNDGDWVESCTASVEHHDGRWEILNRTDIVGNRTGVARAKPKSALPA